MRLCAKRMRWTLIVAVSIARATFAADAPDDNLPVATGSDISVHEVNEALDKLKADPNLATERKINMLSWRDSDTTAPKARRNLSWLHWIRDFFGWIAQISRVLLWVAIAVIAGMLALLVWRLLKDLRPQMSSARFELPTHVHDLDIRPESLPDNIGGAAWKLWQQNEHRTALALLYRGLLSRLAHVHEVPITHATTEGDCLSLSVQHLSANRYAYVVALVRAWQRAVYGGQNPTDEEVQTLCTQFDDALAATDRGLASARLAMASG